MAWPHSTLAWPRQRLSITSSAEHGVFALKICTTDLSVAEEPLKVSVQAGAVRAGAATSHGVLEASVGSSQLCRQLPVAQQRLFSLYPA